MADYLLRNMPDDLWQLVKTKAAADQRDIREVIRRLLEQYVAPRKRR